MWSGMSIPEWSFEVQMDAVFVALGTNDFIGDQPNQHDFELAYKTFITNIRGKYPNAHIFAFGSPANGSAWIDANAYICNSVEELNDKGDQKVHCIDPGVKGPLGAWLPNQDDFSGDWTHPTRAGHTIMANNLYGIVQNILNW